MNVKSQKEQLELESERESERACAGEKMLFLEHKSEKKRKKNEEPKIRGNDMASNRENQKRKYWKRKKL